MEWILNLLKAYPVMGVIFFGSLIGTILAYAAPYFTLEHLCAQTRLQPGNLGLAVFIHNGWGHFIENMIFSVPVAMLCQYMYGVSVLFTLLIIFSVSIGLLHIPFHQCSCGFSGCMNMMLAMVCVRGHTKIGYFILIVHTITYLIVGYYERHYATWIHCLGTVFGTVSGLLLQVK